MDWSSFIPAVSGLLAGLGAWLGAFIYSRFKEADKRNDARALREAADKITTKEWLDREKMRDDEISQLRREMDELRNTKDKEILVLRTENADLKIELSGLRHQVAQLEQINRLDTFNKTAAGELAKEEIHTAVNDSVNKLMP